MNLDEKVFSMMKTQVIQVIYLKEIIRKKKSE